jgi:alkanesulfonate monooxygenase SsuD/methylene tetrahydromethanopterin reductase-like flavin-dependent oxidoreductase (luciferase family)
MTGMRYNRARASVDRHATYIVAAYVAGAARFAPQFNAYRKWSAAAGDDDTHGDELTDPSVLSGDHYFVGTPDDILAAIQASQQRLGYEDLVFWARPPGLPVEQSSASLELIAKHVLPALREAAA